LKGSVARARRTRANLGAGSHPDRRRAAPPSAAAAAPGYRAAPEGPGQALVRSCRTPRRAACPGPGPRRRATPREPGHAGGNGQVARRERSGWFGEGSISKAATERAQRRTCSCSCPSLAAGMLERNQAGRFRSSLAWRRANRHANGCQWPAWSASPTATASYASRSSTSSAAQASEKMPSLVNAFASSRARASASPPLAP